MVRLIAAHRSRADSTAPGVDVEVEGADYDAALEAARAAVPDGHVLLSVRRVD